MQQGYLKNILKKQEGFNQSLFVGENGFLFRAGAFHFSGIAAPPYRNIQPE